MSSNALPVANPADPIRPAEVRAWHRLRTIIESLADGVVVVDREGMIQFANPAAARLFMRSREALLGTPLGSPLIAGETTELEIVRSGHVDVVYAELRSVSTDWEGGSAELVSLRDVTDRKLGEERARQLAIEHDARLAAEASSRTKSAILAIMSHELRTPINAVIGYSELIELGVSGTVTDKVRGQIGRIRLNARHLLALVNNILDLAKAEAGQLSIARSRATVADAIASAIPLIQPRAEARRLTIVVTPWSQPLPAYIGDDERVRQILVQLLSNAVTCTEPGGRITIDAAVTSAPDPRARLEPWTAHIRVTITDTGSGIAPDQLTAIFEPFFQEQSGPTRTREGSGLGLAIGRRLARAMGGDLTVKSIVGQGSSFSLWLPVATDGVPSVGASDGQRQRED